MRRRLLDWALTRAGGPDGAAVAALLPQLERAVPATPGGAALVRELCEDPRWPARHLAGRVLGRMVPAGAMAPPEAWERLLVLAADPSPLVRESVPHGMAALVRAAPEAGALLEQLLEDAAAPIGRRRAAARSLVLLALDPETAEEAARLLSVAARAEGGVARGIGAVVLGRGIGRRDPVLARRIAETWRADGHPVLADQAGRALRQLAADAPTPVTALSGARSAVRPAAAKPS